MPTQVLETGNWADAHHGREGAWPASESGPIPEATGETWRRVDTDLRIGLRGLPGGSSLARLLAEQRGVRNPRDLPPLKQKQILAWADAHQRRSGGWPTSESGAVPEAPGETWRGVDTALRLGGRGLEGGSSLAQLLARHRGVRNLHGLRPLTVERILSWADSHHRRTGAWPTAASGPIPEAPGETWLAVQAALHAGRRGLPGGSSLPRLLAAHRGVPNPKQLPVLRLREIRAWAEAHRRRTGAWPNPESGPVQGAPGETWKGINSALRDGYRGLPGGLTLAALLSGKEGAAVGPDLPALSVEQVLSWADAHRQRTSAWPDRTSGPIPDAPGETWRRVDDALRTGRRGLPGGSSLARLFAERRGRHSKQYAPRLTTRQVLSWASAHHKKTGAWPTAKSGPVQGADGQTWRAVDEALRSGTRGLRRGTSLARLLAAVKRVRNRTSLPVLSTEQVLAWADAHHRRTAAWPTAESGPVQDAAGETWKGVDLALRQGYRGLAGRSSLARLLAAERGVRNRASLPRLTVKQVLAWAKAHRRTTGSWPTSKSGAVGGTQGETWRGLDLALRHGHRGLPGGTSLPRLLRDQGSGKASTAGRGRG